MSLAKMRWLRYKFDMLLYSPESVYQLDQAAVAEDGFSEIELMRRAGRCVWRAILQRWPEIAEITAFAGSGNNGGDAFVVALCARQHGVKVQLLISGDLSHQSDSSRYFKESWLQAGGEYHPWREQRICGQVIVDGLLGIGLQRELDSDWQRMIRAINQSHLPRVAIDIPSGLDGLTGKPKPIAVEAQLTVTFIARKSGQFLADGPDYCGDLCFDSLGVSTRDRPRIAPLLVGLDSCRLPPVRKHNSHKNQYGNLLIVGGDQGMSGAVALAARAALRSGAGLVSALVHPHCRNNLAATPEIMVLGWDDLETKLAQADVIVVGPGLGDSAAARQGLQALRRSKKPMLVDAGALHADFLLASKSAELVITPHPGEAASLLDRSTAQVQSDRLDTSHSLVERFAATTVLKGSGTLIAQQNQPTAINTRGNAGMATAGMGDVLCGIIGAMMGQGLSAYEAASTGVFIHAVCAEVFCRDRDQTGLIASDIIDLIPTVIKQLRSTD